MREKKRGHRKKEMEKLTLTSAQQKVNSTNVMVDKNKTHYLVQANKNGRSDLPHFFSTEKESLSYIENDKKWNSNKTYYLYEIDNTTNKVIRQIPLI